VRLVRTILIFWLPLACWVLVMHGFSSTAAEDLPRIAIPHADKLFHLVTYFVFGVLLMRAFDHSFFNVGLAKLAVLAIIITLCCAVADELYQRIVPGRWCDLFDFIADMAGSLAGILIYAAEKRDRRE
jgi:VanZ family protein